MLSLVLVLLAGPIVVATGGDSYRLRGTALFDIDGDGAPEKVGWVDGTDVAFLAIDRNHNGRIDDGTELIQSFDALLNEAKAYEKDVEVPTLDGGHPLFSKLLLWNDRNGNGRSERGELRPVSDVLLAIGLGYTDSDLKGFQWKGFATYLAHGDIYTTEHEPARFIYDMIVVRTDY